MKTVSFLWTVHFHQPVGNFPEVMDQYLDQVCRPFLNLLEQYPAVRLTLHFSGSLLDHCNRKRPEMLAQMGQLLERQQIELLGGGFYEPIIGMIPPADAIGQIGKMSDWFNRHLKIRPTGVWLPESIWEPHYPCVLHAAGIRYTLVEDSLFHQVGLKTANLFQAYRTEYLNEPVVLFPYHRQWSEQIPFQPIEETLSNFKRLRNRPTPQTVILAQNGDQYQWEDGKSSGDQLEVWIKRLDAEKSWIETQTMQSYLDKKPVLKSVYLASGGARKIVHYSLSTEAQEQFAEASRELQQRHDYMRFDPFLRAGTVNGFLKKYNEANQMHKKMLWLRKQLEDVPAGKKREQAKEAIWAAQCHSTYWHGESGGCYANFLRDAIHQRLIEAEKIIASEKGSKLFEIEDVDMDADEQNEVWMKSATLSLLIKADYGASCLEFNFLPSLFNVANTFRRRQEIYLKDLPGIRLPDDWYERHAFQDHFVSRNTTLADFQEGRTNEVGDFVDQPYRLIGFSQSEHECEARFEREGGIYIDSERRALRCQKTYRLGELGVFSIEYTLKSFSTLPIDVLFVPEVNYTLLTGNAPDRYLMLDEETRYPADSTWEKAAQSECRIIDESRDFAWEFHVNPVAALWHYPIKTVSIEKGKPHWDYQGSSLLFPSILKLGPGESKQFRISGRARKIRD